MIVTRVSIYNFVAECYIEIVDLFIFQQINGLAFKYVWLDTIGIFFAERFEYVLVGSLAIFLVANTKKYWPMVWQAFAAAVLSRFVITEIIRWLWARPRPFDFAQGKPFVGRDVNLLIEEIDHASFPSGHAAFYFALAAAIFFYNKKLGAVFLGAAAFISLGRVFVGIHWPSDILIGVAIGVFSAWLIVSFGLRLKWRKLFTNNKKTA